MPYIVNTELGGGLGKARGFSNVEPSEVADAIVEALQHGTVEVWVPKSTKRAYLLGTLLPRSVAESVGHLTGVDRVIADADVEARREYELRAARSEPALAAAPEQQQLTE
jgi:hypothetical protein